MKFSVCHFSLLLFSTKCWYRSLKPSRYNFQDWFALFMMQIKKTSSLWSLRRMGASPPALTRLAEGVFSYIKKWSSTGMISALPCAGKKSKQVGFFFFIPHPTFLLQLWGQNLGQLKSAGFYPHLDSPEHGAGSPAWTRPDWEQL